ncbi:Protein CBG05317 [Caenorhabditis briggsae]|uniref:Protein CBG05317 n=2 Tax=Caenorhabditis briggsae TaxID=6238 RepID=A8WZK8_CAEBR|nr:Protein CBG05317 [Caenorhabditis briggsae]ULT84266.1 hypothetical protein L3Y34_013138 [Caenorhabditis briggsae]CAP25818.1 Protein CBG05317 [Caenorhabditis briggsae]
MSDQPNNVESSDDDDIRIGPLPNQSWDQYWDFMDPYDAKGERALRLREKVFRNMRVLDAELGRNFRSLFRKAIYAIIDYEIPTSMISRLNDFSVEELIKLICTQNQEVWPKSVHHISVRSLSRVKEHNEKKNNFIRSNQQWDIKNYRECFDDILKNVLYLHAKHGEMFVRALTEFLRQYGYVLCGDGSGIHGYVTRQKLFGKTRSEFFADHPLPKRIAPRMQISERECRPDFTDEEQNPYDFKKLFHSCLECVLQYQTSEDCGYAFRIFAPWLDSAKKALDNCYADFLPRDRKLMRNQEGKRLFKCKMEKNELDLYVLKECVPEDERISMKLDVVKTDVSKHKAKKRKLDTAVKKLKKPAVAHKTNEISEPFHRFTPFPSKGGFTNYSTRITQ